MKGVKLERAVPSNFADIHILYKEAYAEKAGLKAWPKYSKVDIDNASFTNIQDLANPNVICFMARRGKKYIGFILGKVLERQLGSPRYYMFVTLCYITKTKRKLGIGNCLTEKIIEYSRNLGLGSIEIMCNDELVDHWKKYEGKKVFNYLVKEL
jgi:hypothetical protein